jgi:O-acetyl-ADP-ribose deacetylase (regulator of RNase III)
MALALVGSTMEFDVIEGDIAARSADVLVNAAGTSLRMGSGVAGALRRGAGRAINEEAVSKGPVDLGGTAVTDAYDLDAEIVVHAAAMPHYGDGKATAASVRLAAHNALKRADREGYRSLVMPALGCGVAGFDLERGARIIASEIDTFRPESLADVRFVAYGESEARTVREIAEEVRSGES